MCTWQGGVTYRLRMRMGLLQAVRRIAFVPGCELVILSDANSVFIYEFLAAAGILHCFSQACPALCSIRHADRSA